MLRQHIPGCPCCGECWTFADDLNRATIGPNYLQVGGTWTIQGGAPHFYLRGVGAGLLITTFNTQLLRTNHTFKILFDDTTVPGSVIQAIVNYKDSNNYFFAQYVMDGALTLWERRTGSNSQLAICGAPPVSLGLRTLDACFTKEYFAASVNGEPAYEGQEVYICDPSRFLDGFKSGLGVGAGSTVNFTELSDPAQDAFVIQEMSSPKVGCDTCICTCDGKCIPLELTLTIELRNKMGCDFIGLDGQTITLTRTQCEFIWRSGDVPLCTQTVEWRFGCCEHFSEQLDDGWPGCIGSDFTLQLYRTKDDLGNPVNESIVFAQSDDDNVTCSPISIPFFVLEILGPEFADLFGCCLAGESADLWAIVTE